LEFKSFALWCFECELLDCNIIMKKSYWLNDHLIQIIAYHVESTTLEDGTYELVPEPEQGISEDQVNVAEDLTEAPNQSSEVVDIPDPSLTQEGKPQCITQFFKLCTYYVIYLYCALSFRSCNETLDAWNSGTYVMFFLSFYRIDALLIGPAEVEWFSVTPAI
jgi:hypothetical protein